MCCSHVSVLYILWQITKNLGSSGWLHLTVNHGAGEPGEMTFL